MNHLLRALAPLTDTDWDLLDDEARTRLTVSLAARKLVDFGGPHGWTYSATNLGRVTAVSGSAAEGVSALQRRVLALIELRTDFQVARAELRAAERGAADVDLGPLDEAARRIAVAENAVVFHGLDDAGIAGITQASPHPPITLAGGFESYPLHVGKAVEVLLQAGVSGPYGLALGPDSYAGVIETTEHGGYSLFDHLRQILGGPIVWAPGVRGAVVLSLRGGDFLFESGQDLSLGYDHHDGDAVSLYLEETLSFRVATPEAAVSLSDPVARRRRSSKT